MSVIKHGLVYSMTEMASITACLRDALKGIFLVNSTVLKKYESIIVDLPFQIIYSYHHR